ncbi:MAG: DNA polymerase III subunit delta [Bacteroidales bacterium]|nr:DNA polymerase III subunit delta [Bacteroidales bacterium]MDD5974141.1 DNA polymerase III subunit delta [Bacteroidales bacterium]MDY5193773.1 DNA polymerase III subunit delta [Candidatus Aphodosoma sp.]
MAKKTESITAEQLISHFKTKQYKPIYLLMGEEDYYIDVISKWAEDNILTEDEKDYNYQLLYGKNTTCEVIINAARELPMMSEHKLIIVKEAQSIRSLDKLQKYLEQPTPSTILILCYKHGTLDARKAVYKSINSSGIVFESKQKYDYEIPAWIISYLKNKHIEIQQDAANLISEFVGNKLSNIVNELTKLEIILANENKNVITKELINNNIGISKEFTNFDLVDAIAYHQIFKANLIIDSFAKDPKHNSIIATINILYKFFENLMYVLWLKDNDEYLIQEKLRLSSTFFSRKFLVAKKYYTSNKVVYIVGLLRDLDAKSKGFGNVSTSHYELLRETIFKILH